MEYTRLGRSGVKVSRLCLGTMNFGPHTTEPDSFRVMDDALAAGINFFDTADVYGGPQNKGATETIVGKWLAQGGSRREKIVLATKVYGSFGDWPNDGKLSARHIRKACDDSLRRLQTDHIDLYQMHHIDRDTPWDEVWQAMEQLVQSGKVIYVGSSNFAAWNLAEACLTARHRHFLGLVSEQSLYNLNARMIELEVIPACKKFGLALLPWSPLAAGLLGGMLTGENQKRRKIERMQGELEKHRARVVAYEKLCADLDRKPAQVALAWLLHQDGVTAPVIGPRTGEQLRDALAALDLKLSPDTLKQLDALFPGPGNQAPEAYAW